MPYNNINGDIETATPIFEKLSSLFDLDLSFNSIFGNLPDFQFKNMNYLSLYENYISGTIPDFQGMPNIMYLDIDGNEIEGTIPNFSNTPLITTLWISSRCNIIGFEFFFYNP